MSMARAAYPLRHTTRVLLLIAAAAALAGCETTGGAPAPQAAAAPQTPAEPPMTHTRAALECWMKTEKGRADIDLDKRADIVTRCIDEKLRTAGAAQGT